jgi:hypothetical protein
MRRYGRGFAKGTFQNHKTVVNLVFFGNLKVSFTKCLPTSTQKDEPSDGQQPPKVILQEMEV